MKDLSLHILDLVQNSVSAGATRITVGIKADTAGRILRISIGDDGAGMDRELLERVKDPFTTTRTTRRVGLGIPLMQAAAERSGGRLEIASEKGRGTLVDAYFGMDNIDRPPLGDVAGTIFQLMASEASRQLILELDNGAEVCRFDSSEIRKQLGEVPVTEYSVMNWIMEYLNEEIKVIFGGVLNEVDR